MKSIDLDEERTQPSKPIIKARAKLTILDIIARLIIFVMGSGCLLACLAACYLAILFETREQEREQNCAMLLSTPIPQQVLSDLCGRAVLPASSDQCKAAGSNTLKSQTFAIFDAAIRINKTTYEDVEKMFGKYTVYCHENNDPDTDRCDYALDNWPRVIVFFDKKDNTVQRFFIPSCSGS